MGIGRDFQNETSYTAPEGVEMPVPQPAGPGSPDFKLPGISGDGPGIWKTILSRRSRRAYSGESVSPELLGTLCWAAQGITGSDKGHQLRAAPSAGGLYSLDLYAALPGPDPREGLYRYMAGEHSLHPVLHGPVIEYLANAALQQRFMIPSAAVFVLTAHPERSVWKYEDRSWRYFYLDAGHIGQNIMLAAEALGLSSCGIGAFYDTAVNQTMVLDGVEEMPVYMVAVGRPRGGQA